MLLLPPQGKDLDNRLTETSTKDLKFQRSDFCEGIRSRPT